MKHHFTNTFIAKFTKRPLLILLPVSWNIKSGNTRSIRKKLLSLLAVVMLAIMNSLLFAQPYPPAQGPPNTSAPGGLPTSIITSLLQSKIQEVVDSTNAHIKHDEASTSVKATVSFTKKVYEPGISITTYTDRPNQRVVRIYFSINYTISNIHWHGIPYFGRTLYQSITVDISCNNWFTTQGAIKISSNIEQPHIDGHSFGEEVLEFFFGHTITSFVDGKIRSMLPAAFQTVVNLPLHCNCLGVDPGTAPAYDDGEIRFSYVKPPFKILTPYNSVIVTLQSIKRLNARNASGTILYNPVEDIQLEVYANQEMRSAVLDDMKEGEERSLNAEPITLQRPKDNEVLVLIANIIQLPAFEDSRFVIYNSTVNFGNGVQTIIVQKSYWTTIKLPDGSTSKPIEVKVDAYEIKVKVQALVPVIGLGPDAKAGNDITVILPFNSATLNGTASSAGDGATITSYAWTKISGPSQYKLSNANAAVAQVTGMVAGTYTFKLRITTSGGAADVDTVAVKVLWQTKFNVKSDSVASSGNSIEAKATSFVNEADLVVYPNPVSTELKITCRFEKTANAQLTIYDMQGKVVKTSGFVEHKGLFSDNVNVSSFSAGLYIVELKFENGTSVIKQFIKK